MSLLRYFLVFSILFTSLYLKAEDFTYIKYDSISKQLIYNTVEYKRHSWKSSGKDERLSLKLENGDRLELFTTELWGFIYNSTGKKGNLDTFLIIKNSSKKYSKIIKHRDGDINNAALFQKDRTFYLILVFFYYYEYYLVINKTEVIKLPKSKEKIADLINDECWASKIRNYEKGFLHLLAADKYVDHVPLMDLYKACECDESAELTQQPKL